VTPNWHCKLPGYSYQGDDPDGFMTRDEVVQWLAGWLETFDAPIRTYTRVSTLKPMPSGGFALTLQTADGEAQLTCDHAVVATGGYPIPVTPSFAGSLDTGIAQFHSEQYRNADQLPEGAVLVVGTGQSGAQIAEDLHLAGRQVHLAVGSAPRVARFYRGRDCMTWLSDMGLYDRPAPSTPAARRRSRRPTTTSPVVTGGATSTCVASRPRA